MFTFFLHFFFLLLSKCIVFVGVLRYVNVFMILKVKTHSVIIYPRYSEGDARHFVAVAKQVQGFALPETSGITNPGNRSTGFQGFALPPRLKALKL